MNAAAYAKTILATVATVAVLLVMMRALGRQFFRNLTRQIDLKMEILRRLSHRP